MDIKLTKENFIGPWAGLPVAWSEDDQFDEAVYRSDVEKCCGLGIPGIYSGGTTGEFYATEFDEFTAITKATIETCRKHATPVMIGVSSTYTGGAIKRAEFAASAGAQAIQVALPFWMEVHDTEVVKFFKDVARAAPGLSLSIYETTRAKRVLTLDEHRKIKEAIPNYLMVKANADTIGTTPEGCRGLTDLGINVFVDEGTHWPELGPHGACGCCSAFVYYNPKLVLSMWEDLKKKDWPAVTSGSERIKTVYGFIFKEFANKGYLDSALDRFGGIAGGVLKTSLHCRRPYPSLRPEDVVKLRKWYAENTPWMLDNLPAITGNS